MLTRRSCSGLLLGLLANQGAGATAPDLFASNFDGLALLDQEGRRFDLGRLTGQVLLVNFIFTGCSSVCPVQTRALVEVQAGLPAAVQQGVRFVSVSLDPLSDTPAALKAYALRLGADLRHWSFLTGRPADIERVASRLRVFRPGPPQPRLEDHTSTLWLVGKSGRLMQRLHGQPPDTRRLRDELTALRQL